MNIKAHFAGIACLLCVVNVSYAATQPQAIDWGAVKVIPTVKVTEKYDDNIFNQDTSEESAWITQIQPAVQLQSQQDANIFAFTYEGDYGFYSGSTDDNYFDHIFSAEALLDLNTRVRADLGASYSFLTDPRGTGASEGIGIQRDEPDEYERAGLNGTLDLGAQDAKFGVELSAGWAEIEYQNNRGETAYRDRTEDNLGAKLYMRVAPKTKAFFEITTKNLDYDKRPIVGASLDSDETAYMVGAEWEITGKTTGNAKVGRLDKDFDDASRGSDDFTSWDVGIDWSPRTYSRFSLSASLLPQETNGTGSFIKHQVTAVTWTHDWSDILHTSAMVSMATDEFDQSPREDDIDRYSVGVDYDFRRWLNVGVGYSMEDKDSNNNFFDYERNIFSVVFDMSL